MVLKTALEVYVKMFARMTAEDFAVFNYDNAVNLSVDLGQRASLSGNMVRERYINFTFGFNFFDYWFMKPKYD